MALRPLPLWLLRHPDQAQLLRTVAEPVPLDRLTEPAWPELIDRMIVTMYAARGIGLAAPQIGQSIRLAVITKDVAGGHEELVMMNPTMSSLSTTQEKLEEGCLSIPKVYGPVRRAIQLHLEAFDRHGQRYQLDAADLLARVIQHEIDHLNGRLFIDRADGPVHPT